MQEKDFWKLKYNYMHMVLKIQALEETLSETDPSLLKKWDELYDRKQTESQEYLDSLAKKAGER